MKYGFENVNKPKYDQIVMHLSLAIGQIASFLKVDLCHQVTWSCSQVTWGEMKDAGDKKKVTQTASCNGHVSSDRNPKKNVLNERK